MSLSPNGLYAPRHSNSSSCNVTLISDGLGSNAHRNAFPQRDLRGGQTTLPCATVPEVSVLESTLHANLRGVDQPRISIDLPFMTTVGGYVVIYSGDGRSTLDAKWTGICVDGSDVHKYWLIGQELGERSFTVLKATTYDAALMEKARREPATAILDAIIAMSSETALALLQGSSGRTMCSDSSVTNLRLKVLIDYQLGHIDGIDILESHRD